MKYSINQAHSEAFLSNFEVACEAGIFALIGDILWLVHDITINGLSAWYLGVLFGLTVGLGLTILALYRHHMSYTHRLLKRGVK
jgi:hypothetical protein